MFGDLGKEGCGDGELSLAEEMHCNGAVDEVFLRGEGIVIGTWKGTVFEELVDM
jgi:hypothetical protein